MQTWIGWDTCDFHLVSIHMTTRNCEIEDTIDSFCFSGQAIKEQLERKCHCLLEGMEKRQAMQ